MAGDEGSASPSGRKQRRPGVRSAFHHQHLEIGRTWWRGDHVVALKDSSKSGGADTICAKVEVLHRSRLLKVSQKNPLKQNETARGASVSSAKPKNLPPAIILSTVGERVDAALLRRKVPRILEVFLGGRRCGVQFLTERRFVPTSGRPDR